MVVCCWLVLIGQHLRWLPTNETHQLSIAIVNQQLKNKLMLNLVQFCITEWPLLGFLERYHFLWITWFVCLYSHHLVNPGFSPGVRLQGVLAIVCAIVATALLLLWRRRKSAGMNSTPWLDEGFLGESLSVPTASTSLFFKNQNPAGPNQQEWTPPNPTQLLIDGLGVGGWGFGHFTVLIMKLMIQDPLATHTSLINHQSTKLS